MVQGRRPGGQGPGAGPLTCLGCSGAESAMATAYKQREGEAGLSAWDGVAGWAGGRGGWPGRTGGWGGPQWALPPGPAAGEEGRKALMGHGAWPPPYLARSSALSAASFHALRPAGNGGRRSWQPAGRSGGPLWLGQSWDGGRRGSGTAVWAAALPLDSALPAPEALASALGLLLVPSASYV